MKSPEYKHTITQHRTTHNHSTHSSVSKNKPTCSFQTWITVKLLKLQIARRKSCSPPNAISTPYFEMLPILWNRSVQMWSSTASLIIYYSENTQITVIFRINRKRHSNRSKTHSLLINDKTFPKTLRSHETNEKNVQKHSIVTQPMSKMHTPQHYIANTFKSPHDTKIRKRIQVTIPVLQTQTHNTTSSEKHWNMTHNNNWQKMKVSVQHRT